MFGDVGRIVYICTVIMSFISYKQNMKEQRVYVVERLLGGELELFTTRTAVADYIKMHRNSVILKDGMVVLGGYVIRERTLNKCKKGRKR